MSAQAQRRILPLMNITIVGASRGVGRAAVDVAVAGGHTVTAVARKSGFLNGSPARAIVGDVLNETIVQSALEGAQAVLVALGTSPAEKKAGPQREICSRATRLILATMAAHGPQRLVVVTSYGIGPTRANRPFPFNIIAATLLKEVMADKELQESEVRASPVEWTIAQPLGLTDEPASGKPFVAIDGSRKSSRISRADVAAVCIEAIASKRYVRETIALSAQK